MRSSHQRTTLPVSLKICLTALFLTLFSFSGAALRTTAAAQVGTSGFLNNFIITPPLQLARQFWGRFAPFHASPATTVAPVQTNSLLLTSVLAFTDHTRFVGKLSGPANTSFTLRLLTDPKCDPNSNNDIPETLGTLFVNTNGAGSADFTFNSEVVTKPGSFAAAQARSNAGLVLSVNCVIVVDPATVPPPPTPTPTPTPVATPTPTPVATPTPTPTPVATPTPTPTPIATPTPTPTPAANPAGVPPTPTLGGPGIPFPHTSEVSSQKLGSVLIYPVYTSSPTAPATQNTRISLTNADTRRSAYVHLFFIDGSTCSVADSFICLSQNQTASFLAADFDPGTTGYLVAVATDANGCPAAFNALMGDEYVKFSTGHEANLSAEAFTALNDNPADCDDTSFIAQLRFDGINYNMAPRTIALDNIPSRLDGNDTLLIVDRIGGDLGTGVPALGSLFGVFYNDAETGVSFTFSQNSCQFRGSITNSFPRITPRFESFVGQGRSGWFKLSQSGGAAIIGASLNANASAGGSGSVFTQGHNLHKLTLTQGAVFTLPVFPPPCS
jgi:hypothetical protein